MLRVRHLLRGQSLVPAGSPARESPQGGEEEEERSLIHLLSRQYLLSTCCGLNQANPPPACSSQAANTMLDGDKTHAANTGQGARRGWGVVSHGRSPHSGGASPAGICAEIGARVFQAEGPASAKALGQEGRREEGRARSSARRGGEAVRARDREGVASGEPRGGGMTRSPAAVSTGGPRLKEGDQAPGPGREAGRDGGGPGQGGRGAGGRRCKREEDSGRRTRPEARPEGAGESPGRAPAGSSAPQTGRRKAEFSRESLLGSAPPLFANRRASERVAVATRVRPGPGPGPDTRSRASRPRRSRGPRAAPW